MLLWRPHTRRNHKNGKSIPVSNMCQVILLHYINGWKTIKACVLSVSDTARLSSLQYTHAWWSSFQWANFILNKVSLPTGSPVPSHLAAKRSVCLWTLRMKLNLSLHFPSRLPVWLLPHFRVSILAALFLIIGNKTWERFWSLSQAVLKLWLTVFQVADDLMEDLMMILLPLPGQTNTTEGVGTGAD